MEAVKITYMFVEDDEVEVDASDFGLKPVIVENPITPLKFKNYAASHFRNKN